jgi:hypothetical protein
MMKSIAMETPSKSVQSRRFATWEWVLLLTVLGVYFAICVITISLGSPLGHDEALYATRAREFLNGDPQATWFSGNRAPGLSLLLTLAWLGNATEPYLRMVVSVSGAVLVVFTWLMARLMAGRGAAIVAAFGVALTPVILVAGTQVWPDIPGAAIAMAALYLYARGLSGPRFQWWTVVAVVALIAAAIVVRFGAPIPLAVGFLLLTFWRWPKERERKLRVGVVALAATAIAALFLMTPVITGGEVPGETISVGSSSNPAMQGFIDYWNLRSRLFAGSVAVGTIGIVIGLIGSIFDRRLARAVLWPFGIGLLTFAAIATVVHGEARYLSPAYPWFWVGAGAGAAAAGELLPRSLAVSMGALLSIGVVPLTPTLAEDAQEFNMGFATIETAARSLDTGEECGVFTSYNPQVEWYSGCETVVIDQHRLVVDSPHLPEGPRYLFIVHDGKRQPNDELMVEYIGETTGVPQPFGPPEQRLRYVEIWTLED